MENETLLTLTTDIVTAHVSNNSVNAADLPRLIDSVYSALARSGQPESPVETKLEPAVSIRSSVKPSALTCLECGVKMKMLKRHLGTDHNMAPAEYRQRWGLASDYPMVAPDYSAKRQELAKKIGLGRKRGASKAAVAKASTPKPSIAAASHGKSSEEKPVRRRAKKLSAAGQQ